MWTTLTGETTSPVKPRGNDDVSHLAPLPARAGARGVSSAPLGSRGEADRELDRSAVPGLEDETDLLKEHDPCSDSHSHCRPSVWCRSFLWSKRRHRRGLMSPEREGREPDRAITPGA